MGWLHFVFNSIYTFRVFYGIQPVGCSEHLGKLTNLLWLLAPEILQSYVYPRQDSDVEIDQKGEHIFENRKYFFLFYVLLNTGCNKISFFFSSLTLTTARTRFVVNIYTTNWLISRSSYQSMTNNSSIWTI